MKTIRTAPQTAILACMLAAALPALAAAPAENAAPAKAGKQKAMAVASATPAASAAGRTDLAPQVTLSEGKSTLMRLPYPAARMSVGDAHIADVILLNPSEIYMLGKSVGATNLILWAKNGDATIVDITVGIDTAALQARINQMMGNDKDVQVSAAADAIVLSGTVPDVTKADQILALANAYVQRTARTQNATAGGAAAAAANAGGAGGGMPMGGQTAQPDPQTGLSPKIVNMLSIAAPQQVMLEVKVAEVSKTLVDQLGSSLGLSKSNGNWTYSMLSNLLSNNPSALGAGNSRNGNFLSIDAQKRDGLVKVLAEPTLMAISGQEASFLAGGKIFIPVSQTNSNGIPTITLEEKEFGVAVKFTPTVLAGGRINLKVAPEVSELNKEGIGISATGINTTAILPSFTTRRAATTVQLYDGQSFAIGGLIKNNVSTNIKALPVLGEVPVLGALFRSSDFQTDRSELVFIITPRMVKPLPPDYSLPTDGYIEPSRSDFFLNGQMEGRKQSKATPAAAPQASAEPAAAGATTAAAAPKTAGGFDLY
ncbi:type II and III secretion system protein family protein [Massilia sp. BJB1822]|uniref:type II and III secretion system protein family protein n=1 Tax=Massilia sp. BJB1822 TaxID=2744470 RepID=UPI001593519F|nr:type II and III secretion system protein family protein [Massilia sp. BJB1822]NVD97153.1 type II and III secretion system protein family protein [Massilia sp. BJB1822]